MPFNCMQKLPILDGIELYVNNTNTRYHLTVRKQNQYLIPFNCMQKIPILDTI